MYLAAGPSSYFFDDGNFEFEEIYTSDTAYFKAIDVYGGNIWLGGYRYTVGGTDVPVVAYKTGGAWYETDLPGAGLGFNEVRDITAVPGDEPACYVLLFNEWDLSVGIALYRPNTGECALVSELAGFNGPVRTEGGRIFSVKYDRTGRYFYVAVKDSGDAAFAVEKVPVSWGCFTTLNPAAPPDLNLGWGTPVEEGLAVTGKLNWDKGLKERAYSAVILRDAAPPGEAVYTLSFYTPWAPDFQYIKTLAFRDARNGCVLGQETGTFLVNGKWIKETPSAYAECLGNAVVLNDVYYALGSNYGNDAIFYSER
jgi:hypothetical protein